MIEAATLDSIAETALEQGLDEGTVQGLRAAWPGMHRPGEWQAGPSVFLSAGPHRIEVFNTARSSAWVQLGWIPPGATDIVPLPADRLLCTDRVEAVRVERRDRTLHPDFTWELGKGYAFRGRAGYDNGVNSHFP